MLAKAVALLTDAILVLERDKVSLPLQRRINTFIGSIGQETLVELLRLGQG